MATESGFLLDQNQQDYATLMNKALQLTSRPPAQADPRLQLGLTLDDLSAEEFWYCRKGGLFALGNICPGVAAQFTWWAFYAGAGRLATLDQVVIVSAGTQSIQWGFAVAETLGGAFTGSSRDDRQLNVSSSCTTRSGNGAALTNPVAGATTLVANVPFVIPGKYILTNPALGASPFNVFKIVSTTVNVQFSVAAVWRERNLLPTEA